MEAFESFVAVALEAEDFVVSPAVKFDVKRQTGKAAYTEMQTHGYEVDLVAARANQLVLATVKSFFGSAGVRAEDVTGAGSNERRRKLYRLLNEPDLRSKVVRLAARRYGYRTKQVQLRLYAGRFARPKRGNDKEKIREWGKTQRVGGGPIQVFGLEDVVRIVLEKAAPKQYRDNPVLVTIKVLREAGFELELPESGQ